MEEIPVFGLICAPHEKGELSEIGPSKNRGPHVRRYTVIGDDGERVVVSSVDTLGSPLEAEAAKGRIPEETSSALGKAATADREPTPELDQQ